MQQIPSLDIIKEGATLLIDKPLGWTSFDALNKIRKHIHTKIGHCGTLDPLATGLLICCTGKMTKRITEYQQLPKEYTGVITLGAITDTYDLESEPKDFKPFQHITEKQLAEAKEQLTGNILQVPPIHSAIKKDGKRVYKLAREGQEVKLEPRPVTIYSFEITSCELPEIHFKINCSTGTYIRSIAHDLGGLLGCGGYLSGLRRTKIGEYDVESAKTVAEWVEIFTHIDIS